MFRLQTVPLVQMFACRRFESMPEEGKGNQCGSLGASFLHDLTPVCRFGKGKPYVHGGAHLSWRLMLACRVFEGKRAGQWEGVRRQRLQTQRQMDQRERHQRQRWRSQSQMACQWLIHTRQVCWSFRKSVFYFDQYCRGLTSTFSFPFHCYSFSILFMFVRWFRTWEGTNIILKALHIFSPFAACSNLSIKSLPVQQWTAPWTNSRVQWWASWMDRGVFRKHCSLTIRNCAGVFREC